MHVVGVDFGANNIRVALSDDKGRIIKFVSEKTRKDSPKDIIEQISSIIKSFGKKIKAIGIGAAGPLDTKKEMIVNHPNLPFKKIPLVRPLKKNFKVPIYLVNDCVAAVIGEKIFGAGRKVRNLVYVTFSTGIGAGIYVDGNVLIGKDGNAHEVGHMTIDAFSDLTCGCGSKGHWEAFCGGRNIPKFAEKLSGKKFTTESLFDAAKSKDKTALKIVEEIGRLNAVGIANIVNIYDPELITIGGAIALNNRQLILRPILKNMGKYLINRKSRIMISPLGEKIVVYGAIALALRKEEIG